MVQGTICLVTLHGIGFEQAPSAGVPGYADGLHERLSLALGPTVLSDDPGRERERPGVNGAIYVESLWPDRRTGVPASEEGLARLGHWAATGDGKVDASGAPLTDGVARIAHIALVYSHLEAAGLHAGSGAVAVAMAATSAGHYASVAGLVHMIFSDLAALHESGRESLDPAETGLRARTDGGEWHPALRASFIRQPVSRRMKNPGGLLSVMGNLENDVAVYVSRNDLRQRVRDFVSEALARLFSRDDVEAVILHGHSNGTVVAFDVGRSLPPSLSPKLRWFVSAGSPLRKYSTLFNWGSEIGQLRGVEGWTNFWDPTDPVADPLSPSSEWRRGDSFPDVSGRSAMYHWVDPESGSESPAQIDDREVGNIANGAVGGLAAHDYWDNQAQFVDPLAAILRRCAGLDA